MPHPFGIAGRAVLFTGTLIDPREYAAESLSLVWTSLGLLVAHAATRENAELVNHGVSRRRLMLGEP